MKSGGLRVAVQAAVLAIFMPAAGYAGELRDKMEYCTNCHGDHCQGFSAYFTAPRLAGQQVEYLENQFKAISATPARQSGRQDLHVCRLCRKVPPDMWHGASPSILARLDAPPAARRSEASRRSRQEDFRGRRSGRERSRLRRLSRAGCAWQRSGAASGGSALFVRRGAAHRLDQGLPEQRSRVRRRSKHHGADREQLDKGSDQSRCCLSQLSEVAFPCPGPKHKV